MALAPRRVQSVPDCLSRDPMMVLHPASITPEPMRDVVSERWGSARVDAVRKVFRFAADPPAVLVGRIQCAI
jgi:hypothetical protein